MGRWKGTEILNFFDKSDEELVLSLGFFDCLHIGHIRLIETCKLLAFKKSCKSAVFTFLNSPFAELGKDAKQILNFEERLYKLNSLQVNYCISAQFSKDFSRLSPIEFLDTLIDNFAVKGIVVGSDYTFGAKGKGDVELLSQWCADKNIELCVVDFATDEGVKIASSQIRRLLQSGDLAKVNAYLTQPYFIIGEVAHGHKRGENIGFATANLVYPDDKVRLKSGVYYTRVLIDGVWLKAVTNVGTHPTFDDENFNIESHILYYDKDIYGKKIIVKFLEKIREIRKFDSKEDLAEQIAKDITFAIESKT